VDDPQLLEVLGRAADAAEEALSAGGDWSPSGLAPGQHRADLAADAAAVAVLADAGLSVLSEESGFTGDPDRLGDPDAIVAVLDPVDGSTNASRGLPWFATSIAAGHSALLRAGDPGGLRAALVHDLPNRRRYTAIAGMGAWLDGEPLPQRQDVDLAEALIAVNALPPADPGWAQFRTYGATALELCGVAAGSFDGYIDFGRRGLGVWDYLGAMLVCMACGVHMADLAGRDLVCLDHSSRRNPVAAPAGLLGELLACAPAGSSCGPTGCSADASDASGGSAAVTEQSEPWAGSSGS